MPVPGPLPSPSCRYPTLTPHYFAITPKISRDEQERGEKNYKFIFFPIETRTQGLMKLLKLLALILGSCWAESLRVGSMGSALGKIKSFLLKSRDHRLWS